MYVYIDIITHIFVCIHSLSLMQKLTYVNTHINVCIHQYKHTYNSMYTCLFKFLSFVE